MRVLGIETSCDDTGVAIYCTERGLLGQALHSQVAMHERYGGVVPELASRDHVRRLLPLTEIALQQAGMSTAEIDAIAFTQGPGLAGALLVGAGTWRADGTRGTVRAVAGPEIPRIIWASRPHSPADANRAAEQAWAA
ncbi:MAG: hypothetical protein ACO3P0_13655, partial [Quisquiliibacterium sp.]